MDDRVKLPPAVVVAVEEARLEEEQQRVGEEGRREDLHQVVHEGRIEHDQQEGQEPAEARRERECSREQLGELVGERVVALVAGQVADQLDDERENRHGEHEGREHQVQLGDHPHRHPAADVGDLTVGRGLVFLGLRLLFLRLVQIGQSALVRQRLNLGGADRRVIGAIVERDPNAHDSREQQRDRDQAEQDAPLHFAASRSVSAFCRLRT